MPSIRLMVGPPTVDEALSSVKEAARDLVAASLELVVALGHAGLNAILVDEDEIEFVPDHRSEYAPN